jgi:energy-converting hydrogenase Eha subunit A
MSHYIIIVIVTVIVTGVLSLWLRNSKPASLSTEEGRIKPDKISAFFTVIGGAGMALGGLAMSIISALEASYVDALWGGGLFIMGASISGFMAPSLSNIHDVWWDLYGLTGPSKTFGPTLGCKKTTIDWNDIVKRGETITQYWFVEAKDGRRIYWSYLYKGHGALEKVLSERCPNLS